MNPTFDASGAPAVPKFSRHVEVNWRGIQMWQEPIHYHELIASRGVAAQRKNQQF